MGMLVSACVCVVLLIQHAIHMRLAVTFVASGCTEFFDIISYMA